MEYIIKEMNYEKAKQISKWEYDEPYSIYNMDESDINELLNGFYFYVTDTENNLLGYYCFGESAQVPVGKQMGAYDDKDPTDIGLGINPKLCSQGLGFDFLSKGLEFARNKGYTNGFRLTVATFNNRAINVYERVGFKRVNSFNRILEMGKTEFLVMDL